MKVVILKSALLDIAEIEAWWAEQRPKAPTLFTDELERAVDHLVGHPYASLDYAQIGEARRLLLRRSGYHLYFLITGDELQVTRVVGASTLRTSQRR